MRRAVSCVAVVFLAMSAAVGAAESGASRGEDRQKGPAEDKPLVTGGVDEILKSLPAEMMPAKGETWDREKHAVKLNKWLHENYTRRPGRVTLTVTKTVEVPGNFAQIEGRYDVEHAGWKFNVRAMFLCEPSSADHEVLKKLKVGDKLTVEGPLGVTVSVLNEPSGQRPILTVTVVKGGKILPQK